LYGHLTFFADDTSVFYGDVGNQVVQLNMQNDLNEIHAWCSANKLTIKLSKAVCMLFHKGSDVASDLILMLGSDELARVDSYKFLGSHINSCLTWAKHISTFQRKIAISVAGSRRLKYVLPPEYCKSYNSMVHSHMQYMNVVLGCAWAGQAVWILSKISAKSHTLLIEEN